MNVRVWITCNHFLPAVFQDEIRREMVYVYNSLKNRRETHMMGTEDDTASEDGLAQVCSCKHTPKVFATVGLAVFFSTQSFSFLKYLDELRQQHRH